MKCDGDSGCMLVMTRLLLSMFNRHLVLVNTVLIHGGHIEMKILSTWVCLEKASCQVRSNCRINTLKGSTTDIRIPRKIRPPSTVSMYHIQTPPGYHVPALRYPTHTHIHMVTNLSQVHSPDPWYTTISFQEIPKMRGPAHPRAVGASFSLVEIDIRNFSPTTTPKRLGNTRSFGKT